MDQNPLNTKSRDNSLILLLIAGWLIVIGLGGSYYKLVPELKAQRTNLEEAKAKLEGLTIDVSNLELAQTNLETAKQSLIESGIDLNKAQSVIPLTEDIPGLYIQMEELMKQATNLTKTSYTIGVPAGDTTLSGVQIPISINATGKYADLKLFLNVLRLNIRPLSFTSVSLSGNQSQTSPAPGSTAEDLNGKYLMSVSGFVRARGFSPEYAPPEPTEGSATPATAAP